ncbi:MAG: Uma2 family endonuclease [Gammaproteobacteria bacterium]|nr:Uma2 family endonuclease [Gammaproteobacteria bacterium]
MPTTALKQKPASYQDILDAPPNMVAEILAGTLHTQPRPALPHAAASYILGGELFGPFNKGVGGPGGWRILIEPELHLGNDVVVPDLAGWRREAMPDIPDVAWCETAPAWICEVLSPSTRRLNQNEKSQCYAREGVSHLWFVDPKSKTLEVFVLKKGAWLLRAKLEDNTQVSQPPFDAISFPLSALWS